MKFDKSLIKALLKKFIPGQEHYTHYFHNSASSFVGNDNRVLLRQYLRYMEQKGYILNHKYPHNIHKWSITQGGLDVLALFNLDHFIN